MPSKEIMEERALIARLKLERAAERAKTVVAKQRRQATCTHLWYMLSHEERICSRCGAVKFVPDL